jgi:hypothetical protein
METRELFDSRIDLERRLACLVGWIEARRGQPAAKPEQVLLAYLLGAGAASIPLHLVYPDEPAMDLSLLNPEFVEDEQAAVDEGLMSAFIWRHTHLEMAQIDRLLDIERRYMAIIGLTAWDAGFESRDEFESAVGRYEVIIQEGPDGNPVHEEDVFRYLAAREGDFSREDADAFSRFSMLYLFLTGVASDDVGVTVMAP